MGNAPALMAANLRKQARLSQRLTTRTHIRGFTDISGRTTMDIMALEGPFGFFRLWFANDSATPFTIDGCSFSPTSSPASLVPLAADGVTALPMQTVTFNSAGADSMPGDFSGSVGTITVPAGTAANPTYICSDWMLSPSVQRLDGSWRPILQVRTWCSGAARAIARSNTSSWGDVPAVHLGRIRDSYDSGNNQITSGAPTMTRSTRMMVMAVDIIGQRDGISTMAIGDSLTQGQGSTTDFKTWGHIATAAISSLTRPVSFVNAGWSGQTTAQYFARGVLELSRFQPQIVMIAPWTPNEMFTQALAEAEWARTMGLVHLARSRGAVPVLWTPMPTSRIATAADDAARQSICSRVRELGDSRWLIADFDAILSTGGSPGRIKAEFDSGDGTHLSDAGYSACGAVMQATLQRAIMGLF